MRADGLRALRLVLAGAVFTTLVLGVVVLLVTGEDPDPAISMSTGVRLVVASCGLSVAVTAFLRWRPDCSSSTALAAGYRTHFFLRLASAEAAALAGFVVALLADETALYGVGAACALVGYWSVAPTEARLERLQADLDVSGCGQSLAAALGGRSAGPA